MNLLEELFDLARESAGPGDWSKAVTLSRNADFVLELETAEALRLKVLESGRPVGIVVDLNLEASDWQSDCRCDDDPCLHVLSALIAFKNNLNLVRADEDPSRATLSYRLEASSDVLRVIRVIERKDSSEVFRHRLQDYTGGVQSGRIKGPMLYPAKEDFQIERLLNPNGSFEAQNAPLLFEALLRVPSVLFQEEPARLSAEPYQSALVLDKTSQGYCVRLHEGEVTEAKVRFSNGVVYLDGTLFPAKEAGLSERLLRAFTPQGLSLNAEQLEELMISILPTLTKVAEIDRRIVLPEIVDEPPRAVFLIEREGESVQVLPRIVYGRPAALEISTGGIHALDKNKLVLRDQDEEKRLIRRLQSELHLQVGRLVYKSGAEAVRFLSNLDEWEVSGEGQKEFAYEGKLQPAVRVSEEDITVTFSLGADSTGADSTKPRQADAARVFEAWANGERLVPLLDGGWAEIPSDWLQQFGPRIKALLSLKEGGESFQPRFQPVLTQFAEEVGGELSNALARLKERLTKPLPEGNVPLPADLKATLRDYQQSGVNWLSSLKTLQAGGILADDMGLGKTLQVICILDKPSLVVCPTSVLDNWVEQIHTFRPSLKVCRYHGSARVYDETADVVLTSYALLRLEPERFSRHWAAAVLDEAQHIKNPDSATARAAFSLTADFKVALSGTPVENRVLDLWSQLHFVFPELLGSQGSFEKQFARPMQRGDEAAIERLRTRVRPFILRRVKSEVARELPPRTEVTLRGELSEEERELYQTLYLSSKETIRRALEEEQGMMAALEVLLRLRQLCAHPGLLPERAEQSSSKTELLLESLTSSKESGHRSLVFSQWTSMLDLLEPHLKQAGFSYLRLDGSTKDRGAVVESFQQEDGPDLLLLSLKAGGVGLTLTAADHVYLFDSWWNPAVEAQAADRAHRIGQTRPVLVHRLIMSETIEENILKLQENKREVAESILEGGGAAGGLTREDLKLLFS